MCSLRQHIYSKNVKNILSSQNMQKQAMGWIWPVGQFAAPALKYSTNHPSASPQMPTKANTNVFFLVTRVYPFRETMAGNSGSFLLQSNMPTELQKSFLLLASMITLSRVSHPSDTTKTMSNSASQLRDTQPHRVCSTLQND